MEGDEDAGPLVWLGVVIVVWATAMVLGPHLTAAGCGALVASLLTIALILDHRALLGVAACPISPRRIFGAALLVACAVVYCML